MTFGEILMRLNPEGYRRFAQAERFEATYGGSEANVAVSLSLFGDDAAYVTKLPEHEIGQNAVNSMRRFGVDTEKIVRGGPRIGLYFCEKGASQRAGLVIYDRAGSSMSLAKRKDFDWDAILDGVSWFHWSGITPALSDELIEITMDALKKCREKGITVSCDPNYRAKLWTFEKASKVMMRFMPYVDVLISNEGQARGMFDIQVEEQGWTDGALNRKGYAEVAEQICQRFGCKAVALTERGSVSASDNNWSAMLYTKKQTFFSKSYSIHLVDRVGGGDSFAAGLIHAMLHNWDNQKAIEFAVAASCLKQTIEHDYNLIFEAEALALAYGDGSGQVKR